MTETQSASPALSGLAQQLYALAADRRHSVDFVLQAKLSAFIACGYISDFKRGPSRILIPKDLRVLPCRYISGVCDEVVDGRKTTKPVVRSTTATMTDRDFVISMTLASGITNFASHQPAAVANQPDWVTYAMNADHLPQLFALCPYNLGQASNAFGDWAKPFFTMKFLVKALRGGVDWWWENADLLFKSVDICSPHRAAYAVLAKALSLSEAKLPRLSVTGAAYRVHKVVPRSLNTSADSTLSSAASFLSRYLDEALGKKQKLPKKVAEALEKGKQRINSPLLTELIEWVFTSPDLCVKIGSGWQPWADTTILPSSPVCRSAASRFAEGLNLVGQHVPHDDLLSLRAWIKDRARDTLRGQFDEVPAPDAALGLRLIAEAVMMTSLDIGGNVTSGGGELQREEAERMRGVGWPHVSLSHPDRRVPRMSCSCGAFTISDLKTSSNKRVDLPLHRVGLLCDAKGRFLPYEGAVSALESEFNDFADGADWKDCPADFIPAMTFALDAKGLDADRVHDVEVDESAWYPVLTDSGIKDVYRLRVECGVGPERWVAVRYSYPVKGSIADLNADVDSTAAAFVYNAYSEFAKECWLRHRGLIGEEDRILVKEHDPANDLSPDMLQDFIKFCHQVPEFDGPWREFVTYDGAGDTYVYSSDAEDGTACGIVLFRSQ